MAIDWTALFKKYRGQWVALMDDEKTVVGNGATLREAITKAQKNGHDKPIMFRVPTKLVLRIGEA